MEFFFYNRWIKLDLVSLWLCVRVCVCVYSRDGQDLKSKDAKNLEQYKLVCLRKQPKKQNVHIV